MSTTRSFSSMLKDYMPESLLEQELDKRDWLLSNIEKDDNWGGASDTSGEARYIVPFVGAGASSVEFGSLTAENDVSEDDFVRGYVDTQREVWGTMKFNHRDLMEHGKVSESSFLRILPNRVESFMRYIKEAVSINMLGGPHFAKEVDTGNSDFANGIIEVDRIDRFSIGQKCVLDDGSVSQYVYIIAIDVNKSTIAVSTSRGGSADDLTAGTAFTENSGDNKLYHVGNHLTQIASEPFGRSFQSLTNALLSAANGGGTTLHGQTKTAYPYLQAVNVDGSGIDASNLLDELFDAYVDVKTKARGMANTMLMSYKHLGTIMKLIEVQKGGYKVTPNSQKASQYGWTEIEITSVKGQLKIVGIQEMNDSEIIFLDLSAIKFASNGMFKKRKSPEGQEFYELRATTGYSYLVDVCLYGELIVLAPGNCGILHSIPNY